MVQLEGAVIGKKFAVEAEHGLQDFDAIILETHTYSSASKLC